MKCYADENSCFSGFFFLNSRVGKNILYGSAWCAIVAESGFLRS